MFSMCTSPPWALGGGGGGGGPFYIMGMIVSPRPSCEHSLKNGLPHWACVLSTHLLPALCQAPGHQEELEVYFAHNRHFVHNVTDDNRYID